MPELTEAEQGHTSRQGSGHRSSMTINKELQANRTRIGSAKYYDVASALLGKGKADLEELFLNAARDGDFDQIEHFLLRRSDVIISIDVKDKRTGNTALIWASKRGHTKIVQLLLRHGADITLRNYESVTAVEVASPAIKTLLLDSVDRSTESSHRLLLQAAWQGNVKVLRKLLTDNRVKDINCQNADGLTALLLVCRDIQLFERLSTQLNRQYNPVEVVEELLKHRANIHASDGDDKSCLHYAVQSKATQASLVVQTILSAGPNLDAKDKRLFAPIHCASQTGNVECLEVLLEGGSNVNHRGFNGTTPLHITAYNDHERAACCLLKHGADITMVDDTGLTALDLARGRKMKATLKEAWTEATQSRQSTNLGPLKTPGREDTRLSTDDNKRRKGEVIFDALPTNPFSNMKNVTNRGGKPVTRHLSLKEKASRAEESMMKDIENGEFKPSPYMNTRKSESEIKTRNISPCRDGVRRLGLVRGQRTSPTPLPKVSSRERLPAISPSPDRMAGDRNTDSPAFNRNTRFRRSLEEGKLIHKNGKPATYPVPGSRPNRVSPLTIGDNTRTSPLTVRDNNRVSPVTVRDTTRISPLTILDDMDVDQCMQINRFQPPSPTPVNSKQVKFHRRAGSDSITTNTNDILESCTSFMHRGRSTSLSHSEDYSDHMTHHVTRYPQREATQYYPLSREPAQKSLYNHGDRCITKTTSEVILDLDRMGLINKCPQTPVQGVQLYPTSSKILPPTPTFANQGENTHLESKTMEDKSRRNSSSKEPSPRSDDEDAINDKEVKMAFSGTLELLRSRSIYKDEFVLEESRPRDLSLRSSSSEESHRSKASEASTSSGEVFVKGADTAIDRQDRGGIGDKKGGGIGPKKAGGKTNNVGKIASANQKPQGMGAEAKKGSAGVNNNASRPSALVTAFVPKQNQLLNNNSALKNKTESSQSKVTAKSAGENRNKITVHSQIPNDTEDKQNVPKNEKPSVKSSAVVQSKSGVLRIGPNAAGNKNPMQVVSSKLLSNVKEEIKRNKELADNGTDNDKKEEEMEIDREDEQEKVLAAKNKLTKSESNMMGIKQENAETVEVARPKTQASAQNGAVVQKNGSVGQNKVIVASANQNSRNSTANKNSIIPPNKNTPSANQSTRNSNLSANQNNKSSVPSYLQPTRSSMTRDSSPNTARRTPATTRNSATTNTRSVSGNSTNKNLQSNVSKSGVSQNPVSADSKQTTFTSISKGSENDQAKNTSSSSVTTNTNTTAVNVTSAAAKSVTSSASQSKTTTTVVSSKPNASMSAGKSTKPITSSANSTNRTNVSPATKQPSVNVTSTLTSNSKSTSSVGSASKVKVNPASASASRVASSSGVSSASSQSGIKKSTSDSNISQPLSATTSGVSSTDTIVSGKTEVQKDSATIQKSNSTTKSDTQSNVSKEGVVKVPNFPYKPASAGKPPLVEIVTANSPRIPKSKCVDSEVVIPVQTPLIVNPFEELYKEQAAALEKENEKKGNAKGVSATSYGFVVGKPQMERSKTNVSVKSQGKGGKKGRDGKPTSATAKLGGVRRKGAKSKEGKGSDEGVSRPKSGKKRARSGKRRKKVPADVLSKQAAQPDIALISGIGWHLATKCIDTSDVIAVKTRGSHSSLSSIDSEDDLDNPTPRPERMLTEEDLQLLTPQDFHFPLNLDLDTPRNPDILVDTPAPGPSSAKYLPVNELLHHDSHSAANTPRFRQVKQTERVEHLPKMDYDGYRPMNLDLSQATLPAYLNPESLERDKWKNSLPSDVALLNMGVGADEIEVISNPEMDKATAELHRQILLGKLTPIPESPSIKSSLPLHKTVEALQKFDRNVQGETLDNLLGLKPGEIPVSSRTDESDNLRSSAKNMQGQKHNGKEGARQRSSSSDQIQGKGSKENSVPAKQRSWSTSDGPIDSKEAVRLSIENIRAAIEKSKKTNEKKSSTKIRKSASDSKLVRRSVDVPKLDLSQVDHFTDRTDKDPGLRTGQSTRRERKFSETKSDEKNDDFVDDNLDEAIEDIMSNTMNSTSTLRSNKSYRTGSRSNTLTDADRQLIMKMTSNNESPFHAKANVSASASETSRKRHHSDSYDEATAQHSTNPNLLKVFHAGDFKLGQKVKAMMDAGADKEKIKIMINVDNEARQIAKIMNSFKNMELYAGPGGSYKHNSRRPEISHGEPSSSKKPPFPRPGSGGPISKVRSAGRFTEIRGSRVEDSSSIRNSGQKEKVGPSFGLQHQTSNNSSGFPVGDIEEELVNALRCSSPENTTMVSDFDGQYDSMSRSTSACTSISSQSNLEDTIQWKKGNVLGKGAFGTVWCGLTSEGQLIAVKQIELNTNDKDKAKREYEKVQEEVELLKTLNHKNIVGYLGTSLEEEDSVVSIFMQFVPGGSIASILARFGALDEAVFRRYTRQILEGVQYLHANDVIHRDIKGGNVMLMPNGIIKLIDFGCAKRLCINLSMGQSQILKSMKGTPYWMAPEVVNETGHGKKSDIWSIGCTIFEMATRKPPWSDMNPMAAIFAIGSDRAVPKLPSKFTQEAVDFVDACLTRDQNKRPSATQLLQHNFILKRKNSKK